MGRRGRPYSKDPRTKHCIIRINEEEEEMLKACRRYTGLGQADVFRVALEHLYKEEKTKAN